MGETIIQVQSSGIPVLPFEELHDGFCHEPVARHCRMHEIALNESPELDTLVDSLFPVSVDPRNRQAVFFTQDFKLTVKFTYKMRLPAVPDVPRCDEHDLGIAIVPDLMDDPLDILFELSRAVTAKGVIEGKLNEDTVGVEVEDISQAVESALRGVTRDAAINETGPAFGEPFPEHLFQKIDVPLSDHPAMGERIAEGNDRGLGSRLEFQDGFDRFHRWF